MEKHESAFECRGCGLYTIDGIDTIEMIGGYRTRLCVDCQNAWHLAIRNSAARLAVDRIEAEMIILSARTMADGRDRLAELRKLQEDDRAARDELYTLAEQWVSERTAKED
jgi:hypothetical protein